MNYSKQRTLVLDIVRANPVHPTAEWVYRQAKKDMPSISMATVYRNLNTLASAGEIQKIPTASGEDRFDGRTGRHYHMQCLICGGMTDLEPKNEESIARLEEAIMNAFDIDKTNVKINKTLLKGVCSNCAAANEENNNMEGKNERLKRN